MGGVDESGLARTKPQIGDSALAACSASSTPNTWIALYLTPVTVQNRPPCLHDHGEEASAGDDGWRSGG